LVLVVTEGSRSLAFGSLASRIPLGVLGLTKFGKSLRQTLTFTVACQKSVTGGSRSRVGVLVNGLSVSLGSRVGLGHDVVPLADLEPFWWIDRLRLKR
jgi:hypothetical protein